MTSLGNGHSIAFSLWATFQLSMLTLAASFTTTITAPVESVTATYAGVSDEVTALANSILYIIPFIAPCIMLSLHLQ